MNEQFKKDILEGLLNPTQKSVPSRYFYDKKGDALFQQIMALPEYYLTQAEMEIFERKTDELINSLGFNNQNKFDIIELGAGDGTKTVHLLKELVNRTVNFQYIPVDFSLNALQGIEQYLKQEIPTLIIKPNHADYFQALKNLKQSNRIKIIFFLGSSIGNLDDEMATEYIYQLGSHLSKGDKILLGVDLKKSIEIILPAYNDNQGVTAEFNLNLLDRINKELGANFDRSKFIHHPIYDEKKGMAISYLKSLSNQSVTIDNTTIYFLAEELIHTEISRKYDDEVMRKILSKTDIQWEYKITDSNNFFANYILEKK
ncbi:L-histidine N(alpha)-methyltransferase [Flavobacterium columnare]|nr:L-histidine N(alpha)-methyltransferase [Flavobacterium columnare]